MRKYALGKKIISLMMTAAFTLSVLAPVTPVSYSRAETLPADTNTAKELNAGTFTMPQHLGYIKEAVSVPDSAKTVIHIQDAHCNYAAQQKISEILSYLTEEYGIDAVNCEGAAGSYDLSPFTDIPEKGIRQKTSDYFVRDGMVSAAEYFAVNNPRKAKLWGVEDADLYLKNLKIYRDSLSYKSEAEKYIKSIGYVLDNLKRHIYTPELLEFDSNYTRYKDGKLPFKEYLAYLISAAGKNLINTKSFPDVYLLSQTLREEDAIDFKRADSERDEVVDKLKKVLSKSELEEFTKKAAAMKAGRISGGEFYAHLARKAKSVKIDLKSYPELEKYMIYISIYSAVDRMKVAGELDMLESALLDSMCKNDEQKQLSALSKDLALEKNMFNISLTRDDYVYYQKNRAAFEFSNFARFIDKYAPLYKIQARPDPNASALDGYRERMQAFYECSLERDGAFVKNMKFADHGRPNSIIITGGFHTENLRELLKKEGVSYVSIMPKFTSPAGYESPYLKRLAGQRTALENVIDTAIPAVLNLQVVEILSTKLALMVEGRWKMEQFKLSVAIVAALFRGEDFVLKVTKGVPVKGTKTEEEKFITFTKGEGADLVKSDTIPASDTARFATLAQKVNGVLSLAGPNEFVFKHVVSGQESQPVPEPVVAAPPAAALPEMTLPTSALPLADLIGKDMIAMASVMRPDRAGMAKVMGEKMEALTSGDRTKGPDMVHNILRAIAVSGLDRVVQNEMIMALRTALAVKGFSEIRPRGLDVVVQISPVGQRNAAVTSGRIIEDKLYRNYNAVLAKSIIGEGVNDVKGLSDIIRYARTAMDKPGIDKSGEPLNSKAILLLPVELKDITDAAMEAAGASQDTRIKIQFVDQGERPDLVTQFVLGVELIEYIRDGVGPKEAAQRLLDLIAAMVADDRPPDVVLSEFFSKNAVKIRPVNWQSLDEQRKAWEAVAKSL
jgi:hypothetical protein